jgi:hypothetical protein
MPPQVILGDKPLAHWRSQACPQPHDLFLQAINPAETQGLPSEAYFA